MANCERCQKEFVPRYGLFTRFCSGVCINAWRFGDSARGIRSTRGNHPRPCRQCGQTFQPHHRAQPGRYCSRACAGRAKTKPPRIATCPHCGREFSTKTDQRFCSPGCGIRWRAREHLDSLDGPPAWKQRHREYTRDLKLVLKAIARRELSLSEGWKVTDPAVQEWLVQKRREIADAHERIESYAVRSGWPARLGPRRVQLLNLLGRVGLPVGVKEIARVMGLNSSTVGKHLRPLLQEGWVVSVGLTGTGRYSLGPQALSHLQGAIT